MAALKHQRPTELVDIAEWESDKEFSPYPEGSRDKYAVFCPQSPPFGFLTKGHRYLFKLSNPNYPSQFWAEIIAYRVGCLMGVPVPPVFASVNKSRNECAALIEWFYGPGYRTPVLVSEIQPPGVSARLSWLGRLLFAGIFGRNRTRQSTTSRYVPGGSYMTRMIPGYDLKKGRQHNIESIMMLANLLEVGWSAANPYEHWAKVFAFDAVIGNTDRHQDNWGVVWEGSAPPKLRALFAPAFDNGTSLGHEIMEERLDRFCDPQHVDRYVNRGTHHVRWQSKSPNRCQHFELLALMRNKYPFVESAMRKALALDETLLESQVLELTEFDISIPLSVERAQFVIRLIKRRCDLANSALDGI